MDILRRCAVPVLWLALVVQVGWVLLNEFVLGRSPGLGWLGVVALVSMGALGVVRRGAAVEWVELVARIVVAAQFLNAVADRFGVWGPPGTGGVAWGNYDSFVGFTRQISLFLPEWTAPVLAHAATVGELVLGVGLLVGVWVRWVALGAGVLLVSFGVSMSISLPPEQQFSYSVFLLASGMFVVASGVRRGSRSGLG
ncbi:DoxX family membrane protein [Crossiella cryophila]|uniref:DoxX family membrane protein n=2 Tax=Crossiella cryophila TaxID=43355 RepID=UPI00161F219C